MNYKVLHITTSNRGGAGIAALRLHNALREQGVASAYISRDLTIDYDGKVIDDTSFDYYRPSLLQRLKTKIKRMLVPTSVEKLQQRFASLEPSLDCEIATMPFSALVLASHTLVKEATVLNLHWISGILDYPSFFRTINKPLVWTLHDMNPFMGLFHYKNDAVKNGNALQLTSEIAAIKKTAMAYITRGAVISPSQWLLDEAIDSGCFSHFSVAKVIRNGVDLSVFKISKDKELLREQYGITKEDKVLLFVAGDLDNYRKGFDVLQEALELIAIDITLLTLGKGEVNTQNKRVKIVPLGFVKEASKISEAYGMADLFVLPSREDNLPNTMLESLASGTPVVSFNAGGMMEHIKGYNGIIVKEHTPSALATAIEHYFISENHHSSQDIRAYAEVHFNYKKQAEDYMSVYTSLLNS